VSNLEEIKQEIKDIDTQMQELKNKRFRLSEDKLLLNKEESKKNIGRCFKRTNKDKVSYFKIMDISEEIYEIHRGSEFDENLYPTIMFKYPYDNTKCPFVEEDLRIYGKKIFIPGFSDQGIYEEIANDEYIEKLKRVNSDWISSLENNSK
jgi:hypothetical protein